MNKQQNKQIEDNFIAIPYYISKDRNWSMNEKSVYCFIAGFIRTTGSAFPGVETIADHTGLGVSTVKKITEKLEKAGKITKRRRFGSSNVYTCNWSATNSQTLDKRKDTNSQSVDDECLDSRPRSARVETMNSQSVDTIRLDIKLSTTLVDDINKAINDTEKEEDNLIEIETDNKDYLEGIPNHNPLDTSISVDTISVSNRMDGLIKQAMTYCNRTEQWFYDHVRDKLLLDGQYSLSNGEVLIL